MTATELGLARLAAAARSVVVVAVLRVRALVV